MCRATIGGRSLLLELQVSQGLVIKLFHTLPCLSGPGIHTLLLAQEFTERPHRGWGSAPIPSLELRYCGTRAQTHPMLVDWEYQHYAGDLDGISGNVTTARLGYHTTKLLETQKYYRIERCPRFQSFSFYLFIYIFHWSIVALQYCVSFYCTAK